MSDYVLVRCRHCDKTTQFSLNAIQLEIQRLKTYNFEILPCQHCLRKFSREDFERSLGIGRLEEISKQLNCSTENLPPQLSKQLPDFTNEQIVEVINKEKEIKLKKEEEIKKMQAGEPYDGKLVGNIEMEEGSPQDRRCVKILKKEGELYAYVINALDNVIESIKYIGEVIWDLIKKINWCIVCSALRIAYFIGYIGLFIYTTLAFITLKLFNAHQNIIPNIWSIADPLSIVLIIVIGLLPLMFQLMWVFGDGDSRWAKVIKKRAKEILK
jgi:hypothetical protein